MKLILTDGERQILIEDKDTTYSAEVLADWVKRAEQLLNPGQHSPRGDVYATTESRPQWDHDIREPVGFQRPG